MAIDKNGRELKVGDRVWIECEVRSIEEVLGVQLVPMDGTWPVYGAALWLPSRLVISPPLPPDEFLPAPDSAVVSSAEIEAVFDHQRKI